MNKQIYSILLLIIFSVTVSFANTNSRIEYSSSDLFTERDLEQSVTISDSKLLILQSNKTITIDQKGIYLLTGNFSNTTIEIEVDDDDKVQLLLDNLNISNKSEPVIYVKSGDKVFVTSKNSNSLKASNAEAVILSKSDLVLNGTGSISIESSKGDGIISKDDLKVTGGELYINAAEHGLKANDSIRIYDGEFTINSGSDGLHSENDDDDLLGYIYIKDGNFKINAVDDGIRGTSNIQIDGGDINIVKSSEGIEATQITINNGNIEIYSTDDGINAARKSNLNPLIEVNGGNIKVTMADGDTDGFDSNGDLYIYGGVIDVVTSRSAFDPDGTVEFTGGTVSVNGEVVKELPITRGGGFRGKKRRS